MTNTQRIVVGVDDSPFSQAALQWAIADVKARGASLEICHAQESLPPYGLAALALGPGSAAIPADSEPPEPTVPEWLEAMAQVAKQQLEEPVIVSLGSGSPARHLMDVSQGAVLLVLGARGRSNLGGFLLGSTSQQLATHAPCPVVVVRGSRTGSDQGPVVVGLDGSPTSEAALRAGCEYAKRHGTPVSLVHSWSPSGLASLAPDPAAQAAHRDAEVSAGRHLLSQARDSLNKSHPGLEVRTALESQTAVRALVAASESASLVVVGSRGRGGFVGLLLGSVSNAVLHQSEAPVMVIHP